MAATEPRSASELVSLLLELARVVKARRYFEPGDPRLAPLFGHARRAWTADLARHGPLEVAIEDGLLEQGGQSVAIDGRLEDALAEWSARGVWRLRVEVEADAEALAGLIEVLAMSEDAVHAEGGAASALERRVPDGVRIDALLPDAPSFPVLKVEGSGSDAPPQVARAEPEPALAPEPPTTAEDPLEAEPPAAASERRAEPAAAAPEGWAVAEPPSAETETPAPPGIAAAAPEAGDPDADEDTDVLRPSAPVPPPSEAPSEPHYARSGSDTEPLPGERFTSGTPTFPTRTSTPTDEDTMPVALRMAASESTSDPDSTASPSPSDAAAALLREIESAPSGPAYAELVDGLARLVEAEGVGLGLAATLRILAALASECDAKRGEREHEVAVLGLQRLAVGEALEALLDQAGERGSSGERATRVLAHLSPDAAARLAQRALREPDRERAERLDEQLMALGPEIVGPALLAALAGDERAVVMRAIALAERLGHPEAVSRASDLLRSGDEFVREAAARALARRAAPEGADDAQALRALARGLQSSDGHLAVLCAECLASTRSPRAVAPLGESLEAAVQAADVETAKERIRCLAELGQPEAARPLGELLLRKSWFGGRRLRELKLAAAGALSGLPGDEAVGVLSQAAQLRDTQLRSAAQVALERRPSRQSGA